MKAVGNQILIKPDKKPKIFSRIMKETPRDRVNDATIIDVHLKCKTILKQGDRIVINPGETYHVNEDIFAINVHDIPLKITETMAHEPLNDRILVKEIPFKSELIKGIWTTESTTFSEGEVVAVAQDIESLKRKDVIIYRKTAGMKWGDFVILRLAEVDLKISEASELVPILNELKLIKP